MDDFKEELEASFQDTQENDVADITDPAWQTLVQYLEDKTVLTVKIGGIVKSGVVAYVEGIRGFIPASKLSLGYVENLEDWLNKRSRYRLSLQIRRTRSWFSPQESCFARRLPRSVGQSWPAYRSVW